MRIEASVTCLSWIPPEAVEGAFEIPFGIGVAHYDRPPPDADPDVDALLASDAIRFANQLQAWIEVEEGRITGHGLAGQGRLSSTTLRAGPFGMTFAAVALPDLRGTPIVEADSVRFTQTAGGHTGVVVPHRIRHAPFWRVSAPIAWSTVTITISTSSSVTVDLTGASPFPRHYLYDQVGRLEAKSGLISYKKWLRAAEEYDTPWGGVDVPVALSGMTSTVERSVADAALVSRSWKQHRLDPGHLLSERSIDSSQVHILLDGILVIEIDGQPVSEVGPGAIFDPSRRTEESKQQVSVRAKTRCRLGVIDRDRLDDDALAAVSHEQTTRLEATRQGSNQTPS